MAKNVYESNIRELVKNTEACFRNKELLSGLILFYSVVDIMAWLSRDPHDADATKSDFVRWVEEFLLPGSSLKCSAEELYSARCAVIRSYAQEWGSGLGGKGEANKISYVWGKVSKENPEGHKDSSAKKYTAVVLYADDLTEALKVAIQRFNDWLPDNRTLFDLVDERSKKYFIKIAKNDI
jgi:hypothetical protein